VLVGVRSGTCVDRHGAERASPGRCSTPGDGNDTPGTVACMDAIDISRTVFPLLAVVANLLTVALLVPPIRRRLVTSPAGALMLAAAVAAVATAGSLYLSEAAGFIPCLLCWYQRIAMYPLALILAVAVVRRDAKVWLYSVPVAAVGLAVAVWHYLVERLPVLSETTSCDVAAPCTERWVDAYGFVTIPYMAASGFTLIIVASIVAAVLDGASPKAALERLSSGWRMVPRPLRMLVVASVGATLVVAGLALIVLPGPFTLPLVVGGFALLATEFAWARTLVERARSSASAAADRARTVLRRT
jgi:disulfide bond formation protein DsbB